MFDFVLFLQREAGKQGQQLEGERRLKDVFFILRDFFVYLYANENNGSERKLGHAEKRGEMPLLRHEGIGSSIIEASGGCPRCIITYMSKSPRLGIPLWLESCSIYLFVRSSDRIARCALV